MIKAHVRYKGNERAGELAIQAEHKPEINLHIADSWTPFKNTAWEKIYEKWRNRWTGDNHFRLTKYFYPAPSKRYLRYRDHTNNYFYECNILKVPELMEYVNLSYIQSGLCEYSPEHVHSFWTIKSNNRFILRDRGMRIDVPFTRKDWIKKPSSVSPSTPLE